MASKRSRSPELIANPFIKKRNLGWTLEEPSGEEHSPPQNQENPKDTGSNSSPSSSSPSPPTALEPTSAAIESGEARISDHLDHFVSQLSKHTLRSPSPPLLSVPDYASLYLSCTGKPQGAHFVIHQHDHPVAGTHYDLRLQINETSSVSWAIMYGLPGDPNSVRLMRNATETRIHCLWNHLIETASAETGSLLIWDTGTYSILPRQSKHAPRADPSSPSSSPPPLSPPSQQTLLHAAFQERKIRLRLHGSKLPDPYVLNLRLTKSEDESGRARSARAPRTRRRGRTRTALAKQPQIDPSSESEGEDDAHLVPSGRTMGVNDTAVSAMEREIRELEDEEVRRTNAYAGASNTIGSVHQRKWFLSLDRPACGFAEKRRGSRAIWEAKNAALSNDAKPADSRLAFPFYVRGVEHERSVVTGRLGKDILHDEKVTGFIPRKGWAPVLK